MARGHWFTVCALAVASSGCAVRPLPEQVARLDTYEIVKRIRCEARTAVLSYAAGAVRHSDPGLAEAIVIGAVPLDPSLRRRLPKDVRTAFERYDHAAIAYDFTFDITEKNTAGASAGLLQTFTRGPLAVALQGEATQARHNIRNFRIADTFEGLLTTLTPQFCAGAVDAPNGAYPITGRIGLDELVKTFLDLNQSGGLSGDGKPRQVADTIEFTTTVSGSVNPSVVLAPLGDHLQLASAGLTLRASRDDIHKVVVAISLPDDPTEKMPKRSLRTRRGSATENALEEIQLQKNNNFLHRFETDVIRALRP